MSDYHNEMICKSYLLQLERTVLTQKAEIERLRLLIRCETIQPPADVTDDCTTELAVELAEAKAEIERLKEQLPTVVKIAVEHAHNGHNPGIYWRGNVWRYHLDLMCNQWADNPDPVKAAQGEYVEGRGRDE